MEGNLKLSERKWFSGFMYFQCYSVFESKTTNGHVKFAIFFPFV